jgi:hypothetical protein
MTIEARGIRLRPASLVRQDGLPMPMNLPNSGHPHQWSAAGSWPACRRWQAPDPSREERDEGVPRRPGGLPHNYVESQLCEN